MFDDDSVEAHFKDGSSVQLSPCGSCYQYVSGDVDCVVPRLSKTLLRQRCCFATSETKSKVEFALFWRNHFAKRPYIPNHFQHLYDEVVHYHKDITSYSWPDSIDSSYKEKTVKDNGFTVSVNENEDLARLTMSRNQHFCEVRHLVKLSPNCHSVSVNEGGVSETSDDFLDASNCNISTSETRKYVWIKHVFPSSLYPLYWKYPISVALFLLDSGSDISQLINSSHAPQPISTICERQFSHVWRSNANTYVSGLCLPQSDDTVFYSTSIKSIKCVWNNKVMYWCLMNDSLGIRANSGLEVWLSNNSVLISTKSPNYYYTHITFDDFNPSMIKSKRIYSSKALPMDPGLKTIILRAIRLQLYTEQLLKDTTITEKKPYCWQDDLRGFGNLTIDTGKPIPEKLESLFESADIPCLGQFSAAKNSIQITFSDNTTMYISLDQSQLDSLRKSSANLGAVSCRILFAKGQYMECSSLIQCDSHLSVYLKPACDWLTWLAKPKQQRLDSPFYSDTIFSREKLGMIDSELEKINRFNFLLEQGSFNSTGSMDESLNNSATKSKLLLNDSSSFDCSQQNISASFEVAAVLKDTTQAINEIDCLINSMRSSS